MSPSPYLLHSESALNGPCHQEPFLINRGSRYVPLKHHLKRKLSFNTGPQNYDVSTYPKAPRKVFGDPKRIIATYSKAISGEILETLNLNPPPNLLLGTAPRNPRDRLLRSTPLRLAAEDLAATLLRGLLLSRHRLLAAQLRSQQRHQGLGLAAFIGRSFPGEVKEPFLQISWIRGKTFAFCFLGGRGYTFK